MKMRKGLTLIELVIVLAVLAIIGAIVVPNFLSTTDKARLKSDVQSAQVIYNAMELYKAENGKTVTGTDIDAKILVLFNSGYLNKNTIIPQTEKAVWQEHSTLGIVVNIGACAESVKTKAYGQLTNLEQPYAVTNAL